MYIFFNLDAEKWKQHHMQHISSLIKEWKSNKVWLGTVIVYSADNYEPLIMRQIEEVKFPHIQAIALSSNNIQSCERLSRIWMPKL